MANPRENNPSLKRLPTDPAAVRSAESFLTTVKNNPPVSDPPPDFQGVWVEINLQLNFWD
jgi:hypothetical protein